MNLFVQYLTSIKRSSTASFINKCSKKDPQLNSCLRTTFNNLRPYLARGIPEIGLPPMEPLKIEHMGIENNAGNIRIKGSFTNVVNAGASNFTVKEVRSDVNVRFRDCSSATGSLYQSLSALFCCAAETSGGSRPLHSPDQVERTLRSERTSFTAADLIAWGVFC